MHVSGIDGSNLDYIYLSNPRVKYDIPSPWNNNQQHCNDPRPRTPGTGCHSTASDLEIFDAADT